MPCTEVAIIPLVAGSNIADKSSNAGQVWQSTIDTVSRQDGFLNAHYGHQVESPDTVQLFVEWDKIESHHKFMKSNEYGPFFEALKKIIGGPASIFHYNFNPHNKLTSCLSAPVTECITLHFSSESSSFTKSYEEFAKILEGGQGCLAASGGWVVEDVEHEKLDGKGKAFLFTVGWQSIKAHMDFRETQEFKDNIGKLRGEAKAIEVHHVEIKSA